jgi:predicted metal-dependent phosphoesterase TrpH
MPVIDLHIHTTGSDGLSTPAELVDQVQAAGISIFAVTDHDTVAALSSVGPLAAAAGLTLVSGVEITAVDRHKDVHVLGYFFAPASSELLAFLEDSRQDRERRGRLMCERLTAAGAPLEFEVLQSGAAAIEYFHSDHSAELTSRYLGLARSLGLGVTGGSDFHGSGTRRSDRFGCIGLPAEHYESLTARHQTASRDAHGA